MKKQDWTIVEKIYEAALEIDEPGRLEFVNKQTINRPYLRDKIFKMLTADNNDFMSGLSANLVINALEDQFNFESIAHFKILKTVATGGMGRVFLAQSTLTDVPIKVALKTIRTELISEDLESRFLNEKKILSQLKHNNIASLIDAGVSENKIPYIATQWVEGETIIDYCKNNNLSLTARMTLFQQLCEAVSYAHSQLIIHRDIKPANILVDSNNQVKLLDFGIAKLLEASMVETKINSCPLNSTGTKPISTKVSLPSFIKAGRIRPDPMALGEGLLI
jgi:serine/threonine-protein kinase